ncbi:MAG: 6-hydroxycyclohex-1-ene-1-carbonyl-CoA dehydrogenase [Thermoleophilia bacterium]
MNGMPHRWMLTEVGKPLVKSEFDPFPPAPGDVVVEVAGCGVCKTDLGYFNGVVRPNHHLPLVMGHEISGRVVAVGEGSESWIGRAVVVAGVIPCGDCELCKSGHGTICRNQQMLGSDVHGGYATHVTVPVRGLCPVDEVQLSNSGLELADISVVADAVTTPYQAVYQAGVEKGDVAIVVGIGSIGTHAVQIANSFGAKVVALGRDEARLNEMLQYGASLVLDTREFQGREIKKAIMDFVTANGLRQTRWKIFECTGTGPGQEIAYGLLTYGATLAVVGFTLDKIEIRLSNLMTYHATAMGNWGCLPELYSAALDLVLNRKIELAPFIERHPLDKINEVYAASNEHRIRRRAILVPEAAPNE